MAGPCRFYVYSIARNPVGLRPPNEFTRSSVISVTTSIVECFQPENGPSEQASVPRQPAITGLANWTERRLGWPPKAATALSYSPIETIRRKDQFDPIFTQISGSGANSATRAPPDYRKIGCRGRPLGPRGTPAGPSNVAP